MLTTEENKIKLCVNFYNISCSKSVQLSYDAKLKALQVVVALQFNFWPHINIAPLCCLLRNLVFLQNQLIKVITLKLIFRAAASFLSLTQKPKRRHVLLILNQRKMLCLHLFKSCSMLSHTICSAENGIN